MKIYEDDDRPKKVRCVEDGYELKGLWVLSFEDGGVITWVYPENGLTRGEVILKLEGIGYTNIRRD